jgi:hypothetical protein
MLREIKIADIKVGSRHRKDMGDLRTLADSIRQQGMLQPIGVTDQLELVFGERRLRAVRDIPKQKTILARAVSGRHAGARPPPRSGPIQSPDRPAHHVGSRHLLSLAIRGHSTALRAGAARGRNRGGGHLAHPGVVQPALREPGVFPPDLVAIVAVIALVNYTLATLAGAWVYREQSAS